MTKQRPKRKYAAFYRNRGERRWTRLHPEIQGSKDSIIKAYQSWLIAGQTGDVNISRVIRAVPREKV